jgi:hypothetical protein
MIPGTCSDFPSVTCSIDLDCIAYRKNSTCSSVPDSKLTIGNLKLLSKGQIKFEPFFASGIDTTTEIEVAIQTLVGDGTGKIIIQEYQKIQLKGSKKSKHAD